MTRKECEELDRWIFILMIYSYITSQYLANIDQITVTVNKQIFMQFVVYAHNDYTLSQWFIHTTQHNSIIWSKLSSIYLALPVNVMNGHGLSNKAYCECLLKETEECCVSHSFYKRSTSVLVYQSALVVQSRL